MFKERPNYLNDIEEIKRGVLEGRIRHRHLSNMIRVRLKRIRELEEQIKELKRMDEELIKRF